MRILESLAMRELGNREAARDLAARADLSRVPLAGFPLRLYLTWARRRGGVIEHAWEAKLLRFLPETPHLFHTRALRLLAPGPGQSESGGWNLLVRTVPMAAEDPWLLEEMMLSALTRIRAARETPITLGPQHWSPQVPYIFEESLRLLLHRHGHPRCGWDRSSPAEHLLGEGRALEALSLARSLPLGLRPWRLRFVEIMALKALGQVQEAWGSLEGALEDHPMSFRLWMERFQLAMLRRDEGSARESLEMAHRLLPRDPSSDQANEWHLRRAEFAHWAEGDPDCAWTHLEALPETFREGSPQLLLEVQVALGHFEQAYARAGAMLHRRPADPELLLIQAQCMAGMKAWESLQPFLERLPNELHGRPLFWHLKGLTSAQRGDLHGSRAELEIAAQLAPRDLQSVLDAGNASLELGDPIRAESHARRALQIDAHSEAALIQLAETRRAQQDPDGARRILRECLLHHPESEAAQSFLAELEAN